MKHILIVTGSVRPNNVSDIVAEYVKAACDTAEQCEASIVHASELHLPFFDAPVAPSQESYEITHPEVKAWSDKVNSADAVILVMPEYNHSMSAVQKNAIDWLYKEWNDKPVGLIGYSWYGGENVIANARTVLKIVKAHVIEPVAGLSFKGDIAPDGSMTNEAVVKDKISRVVDALLA